MKPLVIALCGIMAFSLAGCNSVTQQERRQVYIKTQYVVPEVPSELYECPTVSRFPDPKTLSDAQVARLLVLYHKNGIKCKGNMTAIKKYLDDARRAAARRS